MSAGQVSAIETGNRNDYPVVNEDNAVTFFDRHSLARMERVPFPMASVHGHDYPVHGKYVFYDQLGTHTVAIGQADQLSGLNNDYFMMHFKK